MIEHATIDGRMTTTASNAPAHVRLAGVTKRLGEFVAVKDVSLDIAQGEMLTLLGPSGCGKSTTLRLLAGFYQPTEGEIFLSGNRITHLAPNQRKMTMVFQDYALFPHLKVADNVGYGLKRRRVPRGPAQARIAEMLGLVGLEGAGEKYPHQLSGGQQQRVALARALAVDPEVLLLDEPLSNLDARLRIRLREEIVRLQKSLGKTMIFVTHDQEEALSISDRIAVMRDGRIEQLGSPNEIYFKPKSRYVAEFIGTANFIQVNVVDQKTIQLGSRRIPFVSGNISGSGTLIIRPEALRMAAPQGDDAIPELRGSIERKSFLGSASRYWVRTTLGELIVDDPALRDWSVGDNVDIQTDPERFHFLLTDK